MGAKEHPMQVLRDREAALGGLGTEITITGKFAGLADFGKTVQLLLPDKTFIYVSYESVRNQ